MPDELVCEGRVGVPVGRTVAWVRRELERVVREAAADGPPPEVTWSGGQFGPAETRTTHPLVGGAVHRLVVGGASSWSMRMSFSQCSYRSGGHPRSQTSDR